MFYNLPGFDPRIVGWIVKYAHQNYWRVRDFMELEDLVHEGFDCLLDARKRYSHYDEKRFVCTVKLMFSNHIPYLLNRNIRMPQGKLMRMLDFCDPTHEAFFYENSLGVDEHFEIARTIAEAPESIKPLLAAFLDESSDIPKRLSRPLRRSFKTGKRRETFNSRLCRLLGREPGEDVTGEIEAYLCLES